MNTKFNWLEIKTDFFTTPTTVTLEQHANKWGVDSGHLSNIAAEEKWIEEKNAIWKQTEREVIKHLPETLADIKIRHARTARLMQARAIEKIKSGTIESRSTYQDLKVAIDLERDALGLNDKKLNDPVYEKYSQFNFIFNLNPDELRRFIKAALTGTEIIGSGPGDPVLESGGETKDGDSLEAA